MNFKSNEILKSCYDRYKSGFSIIVTRFYSFFQRKLKNINKKYYEQH
jgi:hypothetical protein